MSARWRDLNPLGADQRRARALLLLRDCREAVFLGCVLRRCRVDEPDGFTAFNGRAVASGAFAGAAADGLLLAERVFSWLTTRAVPPTATSSGHSTNPDTPRAPMVSAAAGVEWLPLLKPRCAPL